MSLEENKAIARRMVEELFGDFEVFDELFAEEIALPNTTISRDDLKARWSGFYTSFPDGHPTIVWMVGEGDQVVVAWKWKATHTGSEWWGIPPTNEQVESLFWSYLQIADGRIIGFRETWTALHLLNQLGLSPSFNELVEQAGGKVPD